jgi:uncharacterized membrane protein YkoI
MKGGNTMKNLNKLLSVLLVTLLAFSAVSLTSSAADLAKVANLTAYDVDDDEVNLKWSKVNGADGYQVYVYNDSANKWKKLGNTSKNFFEAENLQSAKAYKFRVRAYDKKASGTDYSAYSVLSVATEPDEVENVRVSAKTKNSVSLKWSAVKGATGYRVYVYDASQGKYVQKAAVKGASAKVTGLKEGTSYKFKVRANFKVDGKNNFGEYSDVLSVKTNGAAANANSNKEHVISKSEAEKAALNHAGLNKSQVKFFECKLDKENGAKVYEVEFYYGGYEYEYEVNAVSGKVVKAEKERAD